MMQDQTGRLPNGIGAAPGVLHQGATMTVPQEGSFVDEPLVGQTQTQPQQPSESAPDPSAPMFFAFFGLGDAPATTSEEPRDVDEEQPLQQQPPKQTEASTPIAPPSPPPPARASARVAPVSASRGPRHSSRASRAARAAAREAEEQEEEEQEEGEQVDVEQSRVVVQDTNRQAVFEHEDNDVEEEEVDPFEDDQSGMVKEGNDLLIMAGSIAVGKPPQETHYNFDPSSLSGAVIAEIAETIDEEEVRQRVHQEIMSNVVQAQVVADDEQKPYTRHVSRCLLLMVAVAIATSLIAILSTRGSSSSSQPLPTSTIPPATQPPLGDFPKTNASESISQLLDVAENHTLLASFFKRATSSAILDYVNTQVTLFAPTDESFRQLPIPYSYYPSAPWEDHLNFLLAYHMVTQPLNKLLIFSQNALPTVVIPYSTYDQLLTDATGPYMPVNKTDMTVDGGATLVVPDIQASNGYIQVPDRVLLSSDLRLSLFDYVFNGQATQISSTFQALLQATGLQQELMQNYSEGFTLFVPSDSSFSGLDNATYQDLFSSTAFASNILSYHMAHVNLYPSLLRVVGELDFPMANGVSALVSSKNVPGSSNEYWINSVQISDFIIVRNG